MLTALGIGIAVLVAAMVALQVAVRARARSFTGKPLPEVPGPLGKELRRRPRSLLYFFSPACGACRAITPRVEAMRRRNASVHLIDVSRDLALARALGVMATPSVIEIERGLVAGYYVGALPDGVAARFA